MYSFYGTWPWYISGLLIGGIMLLLIYFGKSFGMSSNLRTVCSAFGAGKNVKFFQFDWKSQRWNLVVVLGAMLGGYIATHYLSDGSGVNLNPQTVIELQELNIEPPEGKLLPDAIVGEDALKSPKILAILLFGGLLVGFGTRYGGGCTSGHAISGLSNLQLPSLIAVIGFFIGGLIMSWLLLPLFFN
ncbi:MAG: YeeE/YedE family protein [Flavobacterium sp. MedPE-SWcel]|uniref:YeeE/YedE family protein n=1 Tax=uncultured Flavobacterium sp. TaxID=165435 RepID=UPI00091228B5|nr:YeeE/YedE thiosulfate transporter family protein [uncultured Flavobacterium sp.]OIQ20147.1 MAG: YeeE/YedE family protein [Flavobacterium sp. MedPE-SWcel]